MADATTEAGDHDVKIEDVGPARKRVTITIPPATIAEKIRESLGALVSEASLPGFRRGKAPRQLIEKRFGSSIRDETKNRLIADAYAKVIEEHKIQPVSEPEPTEPPENLTIEEGKPLSFAVDVEVVPDFELPSLEGIRIRKPLLEISDEHVEDRIARQQRRLGEPKRVESGFQPGDRLLGHISVRAEGADEPLFENERALVFVPGDEQGGRGHVLGVMIDDLGKKLRDARAGETLTFEAVGPEGHEREDFRGAKLTITYRITAAEHVEPAPVETLVEVFGTGNEENLREQMRMALQHQRDQEQATAMREQVHEYLLENVDMELPAKLSAMQASRVLEGRRMELIEAGLPLEEVEAKLAEARQTSDVEARNHLKLFFLLRRLADHYGIDVSEQEINGRIAMMAAQQGERPDQLRAELARTGRLNEVARIVRDQKATDRVVAQAKVEEIDAEQWNKLMSGGAPAAEAPKKKTTTKKTSKKKKTKKKKTG